MANEYLDDAREWLSFAEADLGVAEHLATRKNISRRKAMDVYYKSRLSEQVQAGQYGIENLDYKYLAEDLIENEPELFAD